MLLRNGFLRALAVLLLLALAGPAEAAPETALPTLGALNRHVLKVLEGYPTDGTHRYNWPKDGSYAGVTEDLVYAGQVVAKGNEKGEAYCCGLTFEVFFKAWRRWAQRSA